MVHCAGTNDHLNATHRKLLELEGISILPPEAESGQTEMKRQFKESLFFDGIRYFVGLLWKSGMASLPNNYGTAIGLLKVGLDKNYTSACCRSLTANGLRKHWHRVRRGRRGTCPITRCTSKAQEKTPEFVKVYCSPDGLLNSDAGESSFEELSVPLLQSFYDWVLSVQSPDPNEL
ncbi:hypothetical protein T05_5312 [Trichinella murrelli]|uniref:Uncharacterized protein n=1 Tax=Trichinella murrelli TaxID=144512 RepID=A0A0V0T5G4_9BILA|nr:hypothetical protein T05_5312 [Trichinella murrelli]